MQSNNCVQTLERIVWTLVKLLCNLQTSRIQVCDFFFFLVSSLEVKLAALRFLTNWANQTSKASFTPEAIPAQGYISQWYNKDTWGNLNCLHKIFMVELHREWCRYRCLDKEGKRTEQLIHDGHCRMFSCSSDRRSSLKTLLWASGYFDEHLSQKFCIKRRIIAASFELTMGWIVWNEK